MSNIVPIYTNAILISAVFFSVIWIELHTATRGRISYYAPRRESTRIVEPYSVVFRFASRYLRGYCTSRNDFRLFKLNRIQDLQQTEKCFTPRTVPPSDSDRMASFPETIQAAVIFDVSENPDLPIKTVCSDFF